MRIFIYILGFSDSPLHYISLIKIGSGFLEVPISYSLSQVAFPYVFMPRNKVTSSLTNT